MFRWRFGPVLVTVPFRIVFLKYRVNSSRNWSRALESRVFTAVAEAQDCRGFADSVALHVAQKEDNSQSRLQFVQTILKNLPKLVCTVQRLRICGPVGQIKKILTVFVGPKAFIGIKRLFSI